MATNTIHEKNGKKYIQLYGIDELDEHAQSNAIENVRQRDETDIQGDLAQFVKDSVGKAGLPTANLEWDVMTSAGFPEIKTPGRVKLETMFENYPGMPQELTEHAKLLALHNDQDVPDGRLKYNFELFEVIGVFITVHSNTWYARSPIEITVEDYIEIEGDDEESKLQTALIENETNKFEKEITTLITDIIKILEDELTDYYGEITTNEAIIERCVDRKLYFDAYGNHILTGE